MPSRFDIGHHAFLPVYLREHDVWILHRAWVSVDTCQDAMLE
ncbi:MAG: hypothetical protein RDU89_11900 [bacterium]|nr:hypothetical protein [bacterium]